MLASISLVLVYLAVQVLCLDSDFNLHGSACSLHIEDDYSSFSRTEVQQRRPMSTYVYTPTRQETKHWLSLPRTLSGANLELGYGWRTLRWLTLNQRMWQLPQSHIRQNRTYCVLKSQEAAAAMRASTTATTAKENKGLASFYARGMVDDEQWFKADAFYVHKVHYAAIQEQGIVMFNCGEDKFTYYQAHESCETMYRFIGRKWKVRCEKEMNARNLNLQDMYENVTAYAAWCYPIPPLKKVRKRKKGTEPVLGPDKSTLAVGSTYRDPLIVTTHEKVFVVSAGWDHNYHHFLHDTISRLIRHLDYLLTHPNVKIHIRRFETVAGPKKAHLGVLLRRGFWELLGIDASRFISGHVVAKTAWITKSVACNNPLSIAYELRMLSHKLLVKAAEKDKTVHLKYINELKSDSAGNVQAYGRQKQKPLLVIQHRVCVSQESCDKTWRNWNNHTINVAVAAFSQAFPAHTVRVISSLNSELNECVACQINIYRHVDILVGLHGAGLTNIMFMQPNTAFIEIVGDFDGRMAPVCGYHSPFAAVYGVHHYLYFYDWKTSKSPPSEQNFTDLARESKAFVSMLNG
jgi:hypothetical protein